MIWQGKLKEAFLDDEGAFSMSRLIAFASVFTGIELAQIGTFFAIFESVNKLNSGTGLALVGIASGLIGAGSALKYGSKAQEASLIPKQVIEAKGEE